MGWGRRRRSPLPSLPGEALPVRLRPGLAGQRGPSLPSWILEPSCGAQSFLRPFLYRHTRPPPQGGAPPTLGDENRGPEPGPSCTTTGGGAPAPHLESLAPWHQPRIWPSLAQQETEGERPNRACRLLTSGMSILPSNMAGHSSRIPSVLILEPGRVCRSPPILPPFLLTPRAH